MNDLLKKYDKPLKLIIKAYQDLGGWARYSKLYKQIEKNLGIDLSKDKSIKYLAEARIRATVESHSSDYDQNVKGAKNVFYKKRDSGRGFWGLRNYEMATPYAIDLGNVKDEEAPERVKSEIFRVSRDRDLIREIKLLYQHKCQVCGISIILRNGKYAEAHHIKPLGGEHKGPDYESNIIILCPNHHVEFDYGAIAINPESRNIVHIDKKNVYNSKNLTSDYHHLDPKYLKYHFDNIYEG